MLRPFPRLPNLAPFYAPLFLLALASASPLTAGPEAGPLRVLFLGSGAEEDASREHHRAAARELGPEAIYFDYSQSPEEALGDNGFLTEHFDAILLHSPVGGLDDAQRHTLEGFASEGGGLVENPGWDQSDFPGSLREALLQSVGEARLARYENFLKSRTPLEYEPVPMIPNYEERPEPLPLQKPLAPEDSLAYTQAATGFSLRLFAAEPDIVNPLCLAWDEHGRLWTAETTDYPNEVRPGGGDDRIKVLEDLDGDGRCDRVRVFAEGLNIPTSVLPWKDGAIVAQAPDTLYLADEDGDGKAETRTVLFTGWGTEDTHAGPSNLRYGLDNWIHGTVGYAGFDGEIGDERRQFQMGHFRFRPDGSEIEFLHQFNNNTWGLGFNAAGDAFGSTANANPSFFGGLPATLLTAIDALEALNGKQPANPNESKSQRRRAGNLAPSARMIADTALVRPITPNIRQADRFGEITAGAGHALATSEQFPAALRDRSAFVCAPTAGLVARFDLVPEGSGYRAVNAANLVASADEWFSPVAAEVGPDGHLWLADWYNFIIQHNPAPTPERGGFAGTTGAGNAHVNPNRDRQHGRIHRLVWEKAEPGEFPDLASSEDGNPGTRAIPVEDLLAALGHGNQFWRLTAQRLLVAGQRRETAPALRDLVASGGVAAIHALRTLDGLGELDRPTRLAALLSRDPDLNRNALATLGTDKDSLLLLLDSAAITHEHPAVRLAAFRALAAFPQNGTIREMLPRLAADARNREDHWLALALEIAALRQGIELPDLSTLSTEAGPADGDPARGEKLFHEHRIAACSRCHRIGDRGEGVIGPDLAGIASRADEAYLLRSLTDPGADIAEGYEAEFSPMPPMGVLLSPQELADVMAYLMTLE